MNSSGVLTRRRLNYEAFEDDEPFEDEYADYEDDDDLEDVIARLDEMPDVADEVLSRIPVLQSNGHSRKVIIPDVVREVHLSDVVANVTTQFVAERSRRISRQGSSQ